MPDTLHQYIVDIVLKDGTPHIASVNASSLDEAIALVTDQFAKLADCGDAETEAFFKSVADYTIKPSGTVFEDA